MGVPHTYFLLRVRNIFIKYVIYKCNALLSINAAGNIYCVTSGFTGNKIFASSCAVHGII